MKQRNCLWLAAAVLLVVLQLFLQRHAALVAAQNPVLAVQFSAPITAQQLSAAREWEQSPANTQGIYATYWGSTTASVATELGRAADGVTCIGFNGNAADCLPVHYRQGTGPGAVGQRCAVSTGLAWALFGSYNVVGQVVNLAGGSYTISGVFDADGSQLLYPAQSGFTCAGLRGISADAPKAEALQWAAAAGVGTVQGIDYGPQKVWLARVLCFVPAVCAGLGLLAVLLGFARRLPGPLRGAVYFVLALAFALALPQLLRSLPGWLIPGRWSDFEFWKNLARQIAAAEPMGEGFVKVGG